MSEKEKERQKSEQLSKIKQLMEIAGIDTSEYAITIRKEKGRDPLPPTVMLFQAFSLLAASELSPGACKVLFLFFSQTQYQNVVSMDQFSISERVGMTERTVRSAIKELKDYGIITSVPWLNDKRRNEYFLNPFSSWKGSSGQRHEFIGEIDPNQLTMFGKDAKQLKELERGQMKKSSPSDD